MDNYKIKVKDEASADEARDLFKKLGYHPDNSSYEPYVEWVAVFEDGSGSFYSHNMNLNECVEITIAQLRDLVVLKRNDVNDATHVDPGGTKHVEIDGRWYWFHEESTPDIQFGWVESAAYREYDDNVLKPINQTQDPALISGAEAYDLIGKRIEVEALCSKGDGTFKWEDAKHLPACDILNDGFDFRLKPQTIKVELELPKPFEPKEGDIYWFITPNHSTGYDFSEFDNSQGDKLLLQYGVYRTEDDVKKAVEQLRKIRGTNS